MTKQKITIDFDFTEYGGVLEHFNKSKPPPPGHDVWTLPLIAEYITQRVEELVKALGSDPETYGVIFSDEEKTNDR